MKLLNHADKGQEKLLSLSLAALGVVYGDIGTSPLYALRECFLGTHPFSVTPENVLGVLSLIFWALTIIISCKYLLFVMRADNNGEGGVLALMAQLAPWRSKSRLKQRSIMALGIFGAALLYGDGAITPAISVLSAIEGLEVATPELEHYVLPVTILILVILFLVQKHGTSRVGAVFGPVMAVWFCSIAVLGLFGIASSPGVLAAVNPQHAAVFFIHHGWRGFVVLGAVFLVVTGGEALYADMGHFGRRPIRLAWFLLVYPALLLNYFGQGALLMSGRDVRHPFYGLAPSWALYPLIFLATVATVIASQAVISGAFSLTRQAVQLNHCPRVRIIQTSSEEIGQIYIPSVNWLLMFATIALVLGFRSSGKLASAYGVAVTTTMVITTILAFFVMKERWKWPPALAGAVVLLFLSVDLAFFSSNLFKISFGGWFPLLAGGAVYVLLATWYRGRQILAARLRKSTMPLEDFLKRIKEEPPLRVPGTAIFMSGQVSGTPPMLLHHLTHNQALHDQVVLLTVINEEVPRVPAAERVEITGLNAGLFQVVVRYGYMQSPNIPVVLRQCESFGLHIDFDTTTYYLGRENLIPTPKVPGMMLWREKLFAILSRNSLDATAFYNIPPERVVELGIQVEI